MRPEESDMLLLGFFAVSLNIARSEVGLNLLGCSLLCSLWHFANTLVNPPDPQTAKTSAFIKVVTQLL